MLKGKDYDWQDSNLALFGSDLEKNVSVHECSCTYMHFAGVADS